MKSTLGFASAVALSLAAVTADRPADAQESPNEIVAVLNARNPTRALTRAQVRAMLLGQSAFWHGVVPVRPFAPAPGSAAARVAYGDLLAMSASQFQQHWLARQLAGQGVAPPTVAGPQDVAQQVARAPGGIAVMLASDAWSLNAPGVRVVPVN